MRGRHLSAAILGAAALAAPVSALELERLVMPGEVIAAHQDVESDCGACHQRFDRAAQAALCLDCHEEVAADRSAAHGFHGKLPSARDSACAVCHTEHRGRDADITGLDRATFDHRYTDFALDGAHAALACAACHVEDRAFRDAGSACIDCHRDAEPHRGRLGTECADCHDASVWRRVRFDHAATGFPLELRHAEAACAACHPAERWQDTPDDCLSCHRGDDVHRGTLGPRCGDCHTPRGWQGAGFDHDRDTRFALRGAHRAAECAACHREDPHAEDLPVDCFGCHRADDAHRGTNGRDCGSCHGSDAWAHASFDHDRDTRFALRGAHRAAECAACHAGPPREVETGTACSACHAADDVHRGQEGADCAACHDASGWRSARFDHELTRFPLLGMHAAASCEQCHASHAFRDAGTGCASCHLGDDAHEGGLGPDCQRCHNPNDWRIWSFDHELETRFPLDGSHAGLACGACHRASAGAEAMRGDCGACHARDDVHRGALGDDCGRCHESTVWTEVRVR
jgi:hypothetical protein